MDALSEQQDLINKIREANITLCSSPFRLTNTPAERSLLFVEAKTHSGAKQRASSAHKRARSSVTNIPFDAQHTVSSPLALSPADGHALRRKKSKVMENAKDVLVDKASAENTPNAEEDRFLVGNTESEDTLQRIIRDSEAQGRVTDSDLFPPSVASPASHSINTPLTSAGWRADGISDAILSPIKVGKTPKRYKMPTVGSER